MDIWTKQIMTTNENIVGDEHQDNAEIDINGV